jgi:hypothetical protein
MYCRTTQSAYFGPYDVEIQAGVRGRAKGFQRFEGIALLHAGAARRKDEGH